MERGSVIYNKSKWSKGEMARTLVIYCINVMTYVLIWPVVLTTVAVIFNRTIDLTPVLNFTAITFGGELVLLAFKRVFAKKNEEVS